MGYSPWGCKEPDTTERLNTAHSNIIHNCPNVQMPQKFLNGYIDTMHDSIILHPQICIYPYSGMIGTK